MNDFPAIWEANYDAGFIVAANRDAGAGAGGNQQRVAGDGGIAVKLLSIIGKVKADTWRLRRTLGLLSFAYACVHTQGGSKWVTVTDSFDADFGVDEWHGTNVFYRDGMRIFRTYFVKSRGDEQMGGTWNYLDITPLGRQEVWEDSPKGYPQTPTYKWWNWHDSYAEGAAPDKKWVEISTAGEKAFREEAAEGRD